MSSNAFARSRPRVRHQRVPRTHSCDHPRFLQLVNELARINEAKKKQDEAEGSCAAEGDDDDAGGGGGVTVVPGTNNSDSANGNTSCCLLNGPQTSNGYRSLDSNQSTSALNDNYHQQNHHHHHHNHNHHQPAAPQQQQQQHHHHHHHNHHHSNHHNQHQQDIQNLGNLQHHDDRCHGKSSSNFGYSKQNLVVEQTNSDFSNTNSDLRQDENRSKRKRSTNDSSINSRKNSSSSCGASGSGKRHKSSPDAIRPLSPSFTKCPICLLDSMDRDPSFTNTCFHLFCYVCIENWTKNKATCPLCRTKFTKIIYNIKSATNYEEKVASPIRRDDDDGYIADRLMLEHLSSLNPNSTVSNRTGNHDDMQFLFENLRNPDALMPASYFVGPQMESLHSFNTVATSANFNSNVPHPPFTPTSYPIASNYIALFPQNRIAPTTSTAITSAYSVNTSLTNINNDSSSRRISRSGRFIYSGNRNYDAPTVDGSPRMSRTSNTGISQPVVPLERHHQHQNHHQHLHQHSQHRSTLDMSPRQTQRIDQSHTHILPYAIQAPRHYNPNVYPRRPYNPQVEHHLGDTLYRPMPDM